MTSIIEATIARALKKGPQWTRSFNHAPQILADMRRRGMVVSVAPPGGQGANMVKLTDAGRIAYFKDNYAATRQKKVAEARRLLDQFAELLAQGYTIAAAARRLNRSQQTGSQWFKKICAELEPQAI
jgi:hypothetical protein